MEFSGLALLSTTLGVASGLAILALGVVTLSGGKTRARGAFAFGCFGVLLGVVLVLTNLTRLAGTQRASLLLNLAAIAVALPLPYLLYEFALAQAPRPGRVFRLLRGGLALLCAATAVLLFFAPALFIEGVKASEASFVPVRGELYAVLVTLPFYAAFGFALVQLRAGARGSATPRLTFRVGTLLAGLGIYASFAAGSNLMFYLTGLLFYPTNATDVIFIATFFGLAAVCLRLGLDALAVGRRAPTRQERLLLFTVAGALIAPLVFGAVEGTLVAAFSITSLNTIGAWRLAGVAIIASGFAHWRNYDLPQRALGTAATATGVGVALTGGVIAYNVGTFASTPSVAPIAALLVMAVTLRPSIRAMRALYGPKEDSALDLEEALYEQRIDAYRAALEASLMRGTLADDEPFLSGLRERFGITQPEDRVVRRYARNSVIVPQAQRGWGLYQRLSLLGEGSGGRSWLARDRARDRLVVLREPAEAGAIEPAQRNTLVREARLAANLRHPNVVVIEDIIEGVASPIIVTELVEGGNLGDMLRARGSLPAPEAVELACGMLAGVEAIHAAGMIHRDLNPTTVLLTAQGVPKIANFGIGVLTAASASDAPRSTVDGEAIRPVDASAYVAPEIRAGLTTGDRRSDVYSCAVLLYECLNGAPPAMPSPAILRRDIPDGVTAVLARGLAERPESRFPTARAFADELGRALGK